MTRLCAIEIALHPMSIVFPNPRISFLLVHVDDSVTEFVTDTSTIFCCKLGTWLATNCGSTSFTDCRNSTGVSFRLTIRQYKLYAVKPVAAACRSTEACRPHKAAVLASTFSMEPGMSLAISTAHVHGIRLSFMPQTPASPRQSWERWKLCCNALLLSKIMTPVVRAIDSEELYHMLIMIIK